MKAGIAVVATTPRAETRQDYALLFAVGGALVMTVLFCVAFYIERSNAQYIFWYGMAAMAHLFVILTGLMGLVVNRTVKVSRDSVEISDFAPTKDEHERTDQ